MYALPRTANCISGWGIEFLRGVNSMTEAEFGASGIEKRRPLSPHLRYILHKVDETRWGEPRLPPLPADVTVDGLDRRRTLLKQVVEQAHRLGSTSMGLMTCRQQQAFQLLTSPSARLAFATDVEDIPWTESNVGTLRGFDRDAIQQFVDRVGGDEVQHRKVGESIWADLAGDGRYRLVVTADTTGRSFFDASDVYERGVDGKVQVQSILGSERCTSAARGRGPHS